MSVGSNRQIVVAAIVGGIVVVAAGAYWLGRIQSADPVGQATGTTPVIAGQQVQSPGNAESVVQAAAGNRFTQWRVGNRNVKAIFPDGPTMWVGTSGGVVRYDTRTDQHQLYDVRTGLLSNGVFYVGKIDDRIAVGTYGGGLALLDEKLGTWENYNIQHGLGDAFVYDVVQLKNGDIWIATWSGANRVRGGKLGDRKSWDLYTVENTKGGLPNDWVYGLAEGKNGEIWLATEGGLARFKDGKWQNWKHADGLGAPYELVKDQIEFQNDPSKVSSHHARQKVEQGLEHVQGAYNPNYIVALTVDQDGIVWAGTWGGGLTRFDGKSWKYYTMSDGLPANHVFMLETDASGDLWIGTSRGLVRSDRQISKASMKVYTEADGLFSSNVFSLARASSGDLWIGSFGGVTRLKLD